MTASVGSTSMGREAVLLEAKDVVKRFGDFTAVDHMSMQLRRGEVVGLLGANGAGKTTFIRILMGLLLQTSGGALLFGEPPNRRGRSRVGYVPQGLGLYRDLTVQQNLDFSAQAYGMSDPVLPEHLRDVAGELVGSVGLGVQRQVAFACALAHGPNLLMLDEPTSGVDALARVGLWDTIRAQASQGVGVLVTTHYMQEAVQCDRLILMSAGEQVAAGSEADIVGQTTAIEVHANDWASAFAALDAADLPVTLDGTRVRVADGDQAEMAQVLARAGVGAELRAVPATIEERMVLLSR